MLTLHLELPSNMVGLPPLFEPEVVEGLQTLGNPFEQGDAVKSGIWINGTTE